MLTERLVHFVRKPAAQKRVTLTFFAQLALAKLPYAPVYAGLAMPSGKDFRFWWSYFPSSMSNHPKRSLVDYWGDDQGELRLLWEFLKPGMVFFDIGAHHGIFSLLAAKKLSPDGRVVAFEPSRRERRRFALHMWLNGVGHVDLEPYAVSANTGSVTFYTVTKGFTTMNSLKKPPIEASLRERSVHAISLDEYIQAHQIARVDLVKIDVEGGEMEAFRGGRRMLTENRPILICEVLDWVTQPWGYAAREIVKLLREYDYEWFDIRDDGKISPHAEQESYPEIRNYLAIPKEKVTLVGRSMWT